LPALNLIVVNCGGLSSSCAFCCSSTVTRAVLSYYMLIVRRALSMTWLKIYPMSLHLFTNTVISIAWTRYDRITHFTFWYLPNLASVLLQIRDFTVYAVVIAG